MDLSVTARRRNGGLYGKALPGAASRVHDVSQIVAEHARLLGEPATRQLQAVAGAAAEPDDHPVELRCLGAGPGAVSRPIG